MSAPVADTVLVNGARAGQLPVHDRGLLYGDGLFETIAVRGGVPCLWQAHLDRLDAGAARLGIPAPAHGVWRAEARGLLAGSGDGALKLILTRGPGPRGYRPPADPRPTRILSFSPTCPDGPSPAGVRVRLCALRLGSNPALAGIKHLNRLEQVLARAEWRAPEIAEGLLRDGAGHLICGTMSNLFLCTGGVVLTPSLDGCGIAGVVRGLVMDLCPQLGIPLRECHLTPADLAAADGAWLTNALIGIWPIGEWDGRALDPAAVPAALRERVLNLAFTPETDW